MGLSTPERAQLIRRAKSAGDPAAVYQSLATVWWPSLAYWRYLPSELNDLERPGFLGDTPLREMTISEAVPMLAEVLACVAVPGGLFTTADARALVVAATPIFAYWAKMPAQTTPGRAIVTAANAVAAALPTIWMSNLFASKKRTKSAAAMLKWWRYDVGFDIAEAHFSDQHESRWGVNGADQGTVRAVHRILASRYLWRECLCETIFETMPDQWPARDSGVWQSIDVFSKSPWPPTEPPPGSPERHHHLVSMAQQTCNLRCALRLFEFADLALPRFGMSRAEAEQKLGPAPAFPSPA